jgi:hypothetical protein
MAVSARSMISLIGLPSETGTKTLGYRGISPVPPWRHEPRETREPADTFSKSAACGWGSIPQRGTVHPAPDIADIRRGLRAVGVGGGLACSPWVRLPRRPGRTSDAPARDCRQARGEGVIGGITAGCLRCPHIALDGGAGASRLLVLAQAISLRGSTFHCLPPLNQP